MSEFKCDCDNCRTTLYSGDETYCEKCYSTLQDTIEKLEFEVAELTEEIRVLS